MGIICFDMRRIRIYAWILNTMRIQADAAKQVPLKIVIGYNLITTSKVIIGGLQ